MAHIDIHYGFAVNGVAALHTDILKNNELNAFYQLYPEKFSNKTNGITFRRWLLHCNPKLTALITELIGDGYRQDASQLEKLWEFRDDEKVLNRLMAIKKENKQALADYVQEKQGLVLDADSVFDIQVKRLHEYKRQQLNALSGNQARKTPGCTGYGNLRCQGCTGLHYCQRYHPLNPLPAGTDGK